MTPRTRPCLILAGGLLLCLAAGGCGSHTDTNSAPSAAQAADEQRAGQQAAQQAAKQAADMRAMQQNHPGGNGQ